MSLREWISQAVVRMGKKMNILYFLLNYFLLPEMNKLFLKEIMGSFLFLLLWNQLRWTVEWFSVHGPQLRLSITHALSPHVCQASGIYTAVNTVHLQTFAFWGEMMGLRQTEIYKAPKKKKDRRLYFSISQWKFVIIVNDCPSTNDVTEPYNHLYNRCVNTYKNWTG